MNVLRFLDQDGNLLTLAELPPALDTTIKIFTSFPDCLINKKINTYWAMYDRYSQHELQKLIIDNN